MAFVNLFAAPKIDATRALLVCAWPASNRMPLQRDSGAALAGTQQAKSLLYSRRSRVPRGARDARLRVEASSQNNGVPSTDIGEKVKRALWKNPLVVLSLMHLVSGVVVFKVLEGAHWTWLDAVYFSMTLITTVGYGDLTPSSSGTKLYAIVFILVSVFLVSSVLNGFVTKLLDSQEKLFARVMAKNPSGDDIESLNVPVLAARRDLISNVVIFSLFLAASTAFFMASEGFSVLNAIYFVIVTLTTVGLGDITPKHRSGKAFAIIFLLVGTVLLARLVGSAGEFISSKRHAQRMRDQLTSRMSAAEVDAMDSDGDGQISRNEYLITMLRKNELVSESDIKSILDRFDELDQDGNGFLSHKELGLSK
ncbi:Two pore potassium channel b [Porphyridium purpureum]|uniref:Two pore potassium channel b n=1 Tax=Porphyridium purpureum TaxID=35688 RepID=A0A5J4Z2H2_PORPP|nr:Two pore potassium channel b [Porphyridium purpureum]|eukprot:POR1728..scf208_2